MAALNRYGASADASGAGVTLIASTGVNANGSAQITDFGATVEAAITGSVSLQVDDNAAFTSPTTRSRIWFPATGDVKKTFDSPVVVPGGSWYRVLAVTSGAGAVSAELQGSVTPQAQVDA